MAITLNKYGEVCDVTWPVNQFGMGKTSPDACAPYGWALATYMGPPNEGPTGTVANVDQTAFNLYTKYNGPDVQSNTTPTTLEKHYRMGADCSILFYQLPLAVTSIQQSINVGRPVLVSAAETGMHDVNNGEKVDYSWTPSGNHTIMVTGVDSNNNLLVRDYANIASNGPRGPQPMTYDASKFGPIAWVTSIVPYWEFQEKVTAPTLKFTPEQIQAFFALLATFQ